MRATKLIVRASIAVNVNRDRSLLLFRLLFPMEKTATRAPIPPMPLSPNASPKTLGSTPMTSRTPSMEAAPEKAKLLGSTTELPG